MIYVISIKISRCIDSRTYPQLFEKIILVVGVIMFFAMGGLVLAAIDQVPSNLIDNAIVLGCISFFVGLLFLIDISDPLRVTDNEATQTDAERENLTPIELQAKHAQTMQTVGVPQPVSIEERLMIDESSKDVNVVETNVLPTRQTPRVIKEPDAIRLPKHTQNRYTMHAPPSVHWQEYDVESIPNYVKRDTKQVQDNRGFIDEGIQPHLSPHQYHQSPPPNYNRQFTHQPSHHNFYNRPPDQSQSQSPYKSHSVDHLDHAPQSSYMRASSVDQGNIVMHNKDACCTHNHRRHSQPRLRREPPSPATPGYVAHAAKMWERRSRSQSPSSKSILGLQTNV